jgi:hypothetical protein
VSSSFHNMGSDDYIRRGGTNPRTLTPLSTFVAVTAGSGLRAMNSGIDELTRPDLSCLLFQLSIPGHNVIAH